MRKKDFTVDSMFFKTSSLFDIIGLDVYRVDTEYPYSISRYVVNSVVLEKNDNDNVFISLNMYPNNAYDLKSRIDEYDISVEEIGKTIFFDYTSANKKKAYYYNRARQTLF